MRLIDKLPLAFPFMGSRQFRGQLQRHGAPKAAPKATPKATPKADAKSPR